MSTSQCGKICITPPKRIRNERRCNFYFAVVLLLPPAPCPGDAVFHCESESTLFGTPKEDTTRIQWLSCIYNTVPEQFNPNIRVCAAHFNGGLFPEPGRVAYNAGLTKAVSIKCGNTNFALLTHSL